VTDLVISDELSNHNDTQREVLEGVYAGETSGVERAQVDVGALESALSVRAPFVLSELTCTNTPTKAGHCRNKFPNSSTKRDFSLETPVKKTRKPSGICSTKGAYFCRNTARWYEGVTTSKETLEPISMTEKNCLAPCFDSVTWLFQLAQLLRSRVDSTTR